MPCGCSSVGLGRSTTMFSMVSRTSFMSFRLAPSIAKPIGMPCPSVNKLRFAPFFPGQWGYFPYPHRPEALLSSLHPCWTTPSRSLSVRRTVQHLLATILGKHPLEPILENGHAQSSQDTNPFGRVLSIGRLFATRRKSHPHTHDPQHVAYRHQNDACSHALAIPVLKQPTTHPIHENPLWFCCWASSPAFAWLGLSQSLRSYSQVYQLFG